LLTARRPHDTRNQPGETYGGSTRALLRRAALDEDGARRVLEALASRHAIVLIAGPEITHDTESDPERFAHAA
jgi:hypothetical protein